MCGICGVFNGSGRPVSQADQLPRMVQALAHRGPDEQRVLTEGPVALGHCRLKVIDLEGGAQPMTSQDGQVTLVFNGEIYNFQEIRAKLEKKGRHFATRSDTESLLQLYQDEGMDCLNTLEGMFAFALYDRRLKKLFLAVDRFGKKPLYYTGAGDSFVFASELKGLLPHPSIHRQIDRVSLTQYLAFEYVPAPRTILEGIQKMEAGTYLEVSASGVGLKKYFQHDFKIIPNTAEAWRAEFDRHFERAVRQRLISDVPLGIFLSGGLDSSSVLETVCRLNPGRKIKTFTIEFDEASFDESRYARILSRAFGTEHITQRCTIRQMLDEHAAILSHLDEPMADASFIPTYLLCRMTRQEVTVALSGDGSDELLLGYPTFEAHALARVADCMPRALLKGLGGLVNRLPTSHDYMSLDFRLKQFFKGILYPPMLRDQVWLGAFNEKEQAAVLDTASFGDLPRGCYDVLKDYTAIQSGLDPLKALQRLYFNFYLQGDILVKIDRASMANSLELRSPFLDDRLCRSMLGVDPAINRKGSSGKQVLKNAMRGRLPKEILTRPKKGFGIPLAQWIRQDLRAEFERVLSEKELHKDGLFNPRQVQSILAEHLSGKKDHRKQLWTLYVFQLWKKNYLG